MVITFPINSDGTALHHNQVDPKHLILTITIGPYWIFLPMSLLLWLTTYVAVMKALENDWHRNVIFRVVTVTIASYRPIEVTLEEWGKLPSSIHDKLWQFYPCITDWFSWICKSTFLWLREFIQSQLHLLWHPFVVKLKNIDIMVNMAIDLIPRMIHMASYNTYGSYRYLRS